MQGRTLVVMVGIVIVLTAFAINASHMDGDACTKGGELRRNFDCAAIRHTKADACCWMKRDGTHGRLPYNCCGTGWNTHGCEEIIHDICSKDADEIVHSDLPSHHNHVHDKLRQ